MDSVFEMATGWLGWDPETALNTPLSQINLALKGRMDFIVKTNPFGSGKQEDTTVKGPEAVNNFFLSLAKDARRLPRKGRDRG